MVGSLPGRKPLGCGLHYKYCSLSEGRHKITRQEVGLVIQIPLLVKPGLQFGEGELYIHF